jgi:hypothetical protein
MFSINHDVHGDVTRTMAKGALWHAMEAIAFAPPSRVGKWLALSVGPVQIGTRKPGNNAPLTNIGADALSGCDTMLSQSIALLKGIQKSLLLRGWVVSRPCHNDCNG